MATVITPEATEAQAPLIHQAPNLGRQSRLDDDLSVRLQEEYLICKVGVSRFGVTKAISEAKVEQAADLFDADTKSLRASKRLLDTQHPCYKAVSAVLRRVKNLHSGMTIKFENNERLIKASQLEQFSAAMDDLQKELDEALAELDEVYQQLKMTAREDLGDLYDPRDYPSSIKGEFEFCWSTYQFKIPESVKLLSPDLYDEQCRRLAQRFEDAAIAAEEAMAEELQGLIGVIFERLQPTEDGEKPKQFREASLKNMRDFLERFRMLNITGNEGLSSMVDAAENMIKGIDAKDVRKDHTIRETLRDNVTELRSQIDTMLTESPRRRIDTEELE